MKVKTYYKSQKAVAKAINAIIDGYYCNNVDETSFKRLILTLIKNNKNKICPGNKFTPIIEQRCGKRRLVLLHEISKEEDWGECFEKLV